jgi:hypothetical protein
VTRDKPCAECRDGSAQEAVEDCRSPEGWYVATRHADQLDGMLGQRNLQWATGVGYINAWNELHRAEEAVVRWMRTPAVLVTAIDADLRLYGSKVPNRDELVRRLRLAVLDLHSAADKYLVPPQPPGTQVAASNT